MIGTTFIAQAAGYWTTSGKDSIDLENMTSADIKGWMTLQQVMDGLNVSKEELYAVGGIPLDIPAETALKDLEGVVPDFEISTLREKLAASVNSIEPLAPIEPTPVPTPIVTPVHTQLMTGTLHTSDDSGPTPLPPGQVLPADQIKGRMTLREVADQCVVPLDQLLAALNLPPDANANVALKDLITAGTLAEVTVVKDAVAKLQAR